MTSRNIADKIDRFTLPEEGKRHGIYFYFRKITSEMDTEVIVDSKRKMLMFGSNSYLGLTNHREVKHAATKAIETYGTGCAGSRFLNGTLDIHEELENNLAEWVGKEAAVCFSTGFQVNQGVIPALLNRHDTIIMDADNHASIVDGARLSMAHPIRYPHNDMQKLKTAMQNDLPTDKGKLIVVDGVFSMMGDIARLPELSALATAYDATLMVDDAHGIGVLGPQGSGTVAHFGLTNKVDLIMGTFSKSLASIGGFVAGAPEIIEYIKHHARPFIFSASMPPASAAAALAALKIVRREPQRIDRLWENTRQMREGLQALGFNTGASQTPIIPVLVGDFTALMHLCRDLDKKGVFVNPVVPPAVMPNNSMLRISLMATHTREQIIRALDALECAGKKLGLI